MIKGNEEATQQAIERILGSLGDTEREDLLAWAEELRAVRESNISVAQKISRTLEISKKRHVVGPIVRMIFSELKRIGWDERGWVGRLGISFTGTALLLLNGATGGFAAFGTAIAVPLWMVVGAGGLLLGQLIESLKSKRVKTSPTKSEQS